MNKKPVWLSKEEKLQFAKAFFDAKEEGNNISQSIVKANLTMKAGRTVSPTVNSYTQLPWLKVLLAQIKVDKAKGSDVEEPSQVRLTPLPPKVEEPVEQVSPLHGLQGIVLGAIEDTVRNVVAELVNSGELRKAIKEALSVPDYKIELAKRDLAAVVRPKKPAIAILGLLPVQEEDIRMRFEDRFDFRFMSSDTPSQQVKSTSANADRVVLLTKFSSHRAQDILRGHPGFVFCNGVGKLKEQLQEWV